MIAPDRFLEFNIWIPSYTKPGMIHLMLGGIPRGASRRVSR